MSLLATQPAGPRDAIAGQPGRERGTDMSLSTSSISPKLAEPPSLAEPAEQTVLGHRVRYVARFYNGNTPLSPVGAIDVLLARMLEMELKLAMVAHALNGDGRRAA